MVRRLLAVSLVAAGVLAPAAPAPALTTGIADQQARTFAHPTFRGLGVRHVRVAVPWDVATTNHPSSVAWLDAARASGAIPLVALDHSRGSACPGSPCPAPSPDEVEDAVRALRQRWPNVREITPWNEPNHRSQPTWKSPELAAAYYGAVRRACPTCTVVAGDFLDDAALTSWLRDYRDALPEEPAVWGLHNYFDATYFSSTGVDAVLREVSGEVWMTETGGIVRHSPRSGPGLPHDERRAADAIRWLYTMSLGRPRIGRMYLYQWQSSPGAHFDAGLLDLDGRERPGLAVVRTALTRGPGAVRASLVRVTGRGLQLQRSRSRLLVRLACLSSTTTCRGRVSVVLSLSSRRPRIAGAFRVRPGATATVPLPLSRRALAALARRTRVQVRLAAAGAPPERVRVRVLRSPTR
ncbi:MAG TPA: hypothetical protein VD931_04110 [Baekduia sp.]|nr:hypothetical protein [Baekduia sp.]